VLLSWFDPSGNYRISRVIYDMSEPILAPARRILPTFGGVDWSPLVTMIVLNLLENFILRSLAG
jgi:YggT family protein